MHSRRFVYVLLKRRHCNTSGCNCQVSHVPRLLMQMCKHSQQETNELHATPLFELTQSMPDITAPHRTKVHCKRCAREENESYFLPAAELPRGLLKKSLLPSETCPSFPRVTPGALTASSSVSMLYAKRLLPVLGLPVVLASGTDSASSTCLQCPCQSD